MPGAYAGLIAHERKLPRFERTRKQINWRTRDVNITIEIINNTREGIVIFFSENKRERGDWGANSCPGCRAKR